MTKEIIKERLQNVFRDVFYDTTITICENTTANDIKGWDSLTHIALIASVEDEFKICFSMADIVSFFNVGDMINAILRLAED